MSHTEETEAYELLPLPNALPGSSTTGADTYIAMEIVGNPNSHENLTVIFGKHIDGKFQQEFIAFWRFEVDMEQFRKISEAVFEYQVYSTWGQRAYKGGFLKPQVTSPAWEDALGVAEWVDDGDVPFPMWNDGANVDLTVHHGNNFAFAFPNNTFSSSATVDNVVTVGEGATLHAVADHPNDTDGLAGYGFINQLQDYLDANEALRGHTKAGCIPVLFCMYLDGPSGQAGQNDMRSQNFGGQTRNFLRIIHDWERVSAAAELDSATSFEAAAPNVYDVTFLASELDSATTLEAALTVRSPLAAELSSATDLEAFLIFFNPLAPTKDMCIASSVLDVPVEASTLDVPVEASTLDVAVASSVLEVPVESSTLDVPVEPSTLDVPVES